jgi:UDP-glucose 4-epimerase
MNYLVVGGAGFIGSYIVDHLILQPNTSHIVVYDNFSSGKLWHLNSHSKAPKLSIIKADIYDDNIFEATKNIDVVILLAANPDISKAATQPDIDFHQGTFLTQIVLEAMRIAGCKNLIYASGSGVYGDVGSTITNENFSPMHPISTYGASKLSCEALISSYCHMFSIKASAFRFGNVVGGRQTHGVAYDFLKRLYKNSSELTILGDGNQSKPYVYITDIINAINIAFHKQTKIFDVYNVAPNDFINVNEIAHYVLEALNLDNKKCVLKHHGGDRGWKGDVPIVRLDTDKIRSLGWKSSYTSAEAIQRSIIEMIKNREMLFSYA